MDATPDITALRTTRWQMTLVLLAFSIASALIGGAILIAVREPWVRAIGWQFLIWGLIDLAFAWMGVRQSRRAGRGGVDDHAEATQLAKTLRISDKTNWFWMMIGLALVFAGAFAMQNPVIIAHGIGVLIQGGFLLFYDRLYLYRLQQFRLPV
jgi:uncharacterized membrane protein